MSYKKIQIKWVTINQIRLRQSLDIHTIQHKKYLKWTTEFEYDGLKLPILITYKVISSHLDILKDNSTCDYSYTYYTLAHLSIGADCWYWSLKSF